MPGTLPPGRTPGSHRACLDVLENKNLHPRQDCKPGPTSQEPNRQTDSFNTHVRKDVGVFCEN